MVYADEIRELMLEPARQTMVQGDARGGKGSRGGRLRAQDEASHCRDGRTGGRAWASGAGQVEVMAMTQDRDLVGYDTNPPRVRWPGDARVAVSLVVNYGEAFFKQQLT